ncbi:MAG: dihydrodipicolinate synthase family protein [Planctomycetota bacterium]|nr:dihydrodipicolinate synthase family protein [Planctomycetota bacterium]MDA1212475.1 dihydrodipicolinate synthase family protein [Planctomycetota bacterium]
MTSAYHGIWPALITPMNEHGKPALSTIEKLVDLFASQKLGGLYILGSTAQWPLLTLDERREIAECVVKTAQGRLPVIVHVGAVTTSDAEELARHAKSIGADGVSAVAPIYYSFGPDVVFEHYRRIGTAAELPLYVYHLSSVNQLKIAPQDYAQRLLSLPNIAGMKITDGDLFQFGLITAHTQGKMTLFSGADEVMCHAAISGAVAAIGSFYNLFGVECQAARAKFVAGDVEAGLKFMQAFQQMISAVLSSGSLWTFFRAAMQRRFDVDIGKPRAPVGMCDKPWDDGDIDRLISLVTHAAPK